MSEVLLLKLILSSVAIWLVLVIISMYTLGQLSKNLPLYLNRLRYFIGSLRVFGCMALVLSVYTVVQWGLLDLFWMVPLGIGMASWITALKLATFQKKFHKHIPSHHTTTP